MDTQRHPTKGLENSLFAKSRLSSRQRAIQGSGEPDLQLHWTAGLGSCLRVVGRRHPHRYLAKGASRGTLQIGQTALANPSCHTSRQRVQAKVDFDSRQRAQLRYQQATLLTTNSLPFEASLVPPFYLQLSPQHDAEPGTRQGRSVSDTFVPCGGLTWLSRTETTLIAFLSPRHANRRKPKREEEPWNLKMSICVAINCAQSSTGPFPLWRYRASYSATDIKSLTVYISSIPESARARVAETLTPIGVRPINDWSHRCRACEAVIGRVSLRIPAYFPNE